MLLLSSVPDTGASRGCPVRCALMLWAALLALVVSVGLLAEREIHAALRTVALASGINLVGWTEPSTSFSDLAGEVGDGVQAITAWSAQEGRYESWLPAIGGSGASRPIKLRDAFWLTMADGASGTPTVPPTESPVNILFDPGFNLTAWTGLDGTLIAPAFDILGGDADLIWLVPSDPLDYADWEVYGRSLPAALNSRATLEQGQAFG
jgi:hypothetical protein